MHSQLLHRWSWRHWSTGRSPVSGGLIPSPA